MSKTPVRSKNTLFNYFAKSPQTVTSPNVAKKAPENISTPKSNGNKRTIDSEESPLEKKPKVLIKDEEEPSSPVRQVKKRRRIMQMSDSSDDSDSENKVSNPPAKKQANKKAAPETTAEKLVKFQNLAKDETKIKDELPESQDSGIDHDEPNVWPHHSFEFLKPNKIKDANGRRPDHPEYDSRTLYVPESFIKDQQPVQKQWWAMKSQYNDCVLLFKMGKFYETFHGDAVILVEETQFSYMKGEVAHAGFPEIKYHEYASILIEKGYKVARIEQTETPKQKDDRLKKFPKTEKVVKRELCQLSHKGTQVFGQQCNLPANSDPNYFISISEKIEDSKIRYGICLMETTLGKVVLGEFEDDNQCSRLLTLISQFPPVLILHERHNVSKNTLDIFRSTLLHATKEALNDKTEMWSAEKTLKVLIEKYFNRDEDAQPFPESLKFVQNDADHLGLTPNSSFELCLKAFGGAIWYLQRSQLDSHIITTSTYELYIPPDENKIPIKLNNQFKSKHLVLDAITIANLQLVDTKHSLYNTLNHCCTNFGKRLLYNWICSPSSDEKLIRQRLEAVGEMLENSDILQDCRSVLSELPDMERLLTQIKVFGNHGKDKNHPDSRANFFELESYGKKKIQDFITVLDGCEKMFKIRVIFSSCNSVLLKHLTQLQPDGSLPDLQNMLNTFNETFNRKDALQSGVIEPKKGMDPDYNAIEEEISEIEKDLKGYVKEQEKIFDTRITLGTNKNRCFLEIPHDKCKKAGKEYELQSQTKAIKRFQTKEIKGFLGRFTSAEERKRELLLDFSRRIFERFSKNYEKLKYWVSCIASVDVLASFSEYSRNLSTSCEPEFVANSSVPILELEKGYHPSLQLIDDYIPNGITLGGDQPTIALLTGPNMGGKSTLMRQIGLSIIMAHMGCRIPATSCRLSLVDRLFTRLGARDDITSGQSTFFMELNESAAILKHSTEKSFVLLDELGRGTCTYDGTSIAIAVLKFLMDVQCRTIFSTHYHNLVEQVQNDNRISLGHMACMVENENEEDPTEENVTFLYEYTSGPCPKSYGFNAAKIAGIPLEVIKRGHSIAKGVERQLLRGNILRSILQRAPLDEVRDLVKKLQLTN